LDTEANARILAEPLREASRRLGRQLIRVSGRCWPSTVLLAAAEVEPGLHQPVALGAAAVAAGIDGRGAAELAVHHAISTPAQAGVRLLGLDPYAVAAICARLAALAATVVEVAVDSASGLLCDLPALSGPLVDIAALGHPRRDVRMFAT
jgi:urease accessory protein